MTRRIARLASCGLLGGALLAGGAPQGTTRLTTPPTAEAAPAPSPTPAPAPSARPPKPTTTATLLEIPHLRITAHLVPLRLRAGRLDGPTNPDTVGWFADSPQPGEPGAAILVGHVDSRTGPAVFHRLDQLRPGDLIIVRRNDRRLRFRVHDLARYPRSNLPTQPVYGPSPDRALRLITCDGPYQQGRGYRDNLVVYALVE